MRPGVTIKFVVSNNFEKSTEMVVTMPYEPFKAIFGYYSGFVRRLRKSKAFALHGEDHFIKIKHSLFKGATDRTVFRFKCGVVLDMPADASPYDYEIVLAQLNVLMMRFRKPG